MALPKPQPIIIYNNLFNPSSRLGGKAKKAKKPNDMKKYPNYNLALKELQAQVAVGALKNASAIAAVVRITTDLNVILWASKYKSAVVRVVAAESVLLPFGRILRMLFFDKATTVKNAASRNLEKHHKTDLKQLFYLVESFPQLSLNLDVNKVEPEMLSIEEYNQSLSADLPKAQLWQDTVWQPDEDDEDDEDDEVEWDAQGHRF